MTVLYLMIIQMHLKSKFKLVFPFSVICEPGIKPRMPGVIILPTHYSDACKNDFISVLMQVVFAFIWSNPPGIMIEPRITTEIGVC